jgi:hypothetical protein
MAWPLVTRATDDLIDAAIWNADLVANLNALLHPIVRKPSDESLASNVTPQNDDHLKQTVAANEVWHQVWNLQFTSPNAATGLAVRWTFPAGGELRGSWGFVSTSALFQNFSITPVGTSPSTTQAMGIQTGDVNNLTIVLVYVNGATPGDVQLQWCQSTSSGSNTTMKANSTLWGARLLP